MVQANITKPEKSLISGVVLMTTIQAASCSCSHQASSLLSLQHNNQAIMI